MDIIVITDLYPIKENEKNTPRTIYDFVQGWKNLGHNVKIIKPNFILNSLIRKKPFYSSGIYGDVINLNYWLPFLGDVKSKLKNTKESLNLENSVIVAHMPSGLIFANKLNLPFVAGVHVSDIEVLTNPIYSLYFKDEMQKAYKNAKKIACRSNVLKNKFLKLFPKYEEKTFVAYSGIEPEIIIQRQWQKKERYKILTCANLIKRKNVDKVIIACEEMDNVDLSVIGDGEEMRYLKNISSKTRFLGHISNNQVIQEMKEADIFILPSQNETFGMVYLEAMASGCVTIGLKNDGIDGIIKDGKNGYLTTLDSITEVLKKVIQSDNSQILENSYKTIKEYTKEKASLNYLHNII